jgi:hypothetical protein
MKKLLVAALLILGLGGMAMASTESAVQAHKPPMHKHHHHKHHHHHGPKKHV